MNSEQRYRRMTELFAAACELPQADRRLFLERECGSDQALLQELLELLAADEDPAGLVPHDFVARDRERTPSSRFLRKLSSRKPEQTRYRLVGEIARGGMGAILKVWDEDIGRSLAMKVVLGQAAIHGSGETPPVDERVLARFLEEAQITGQLEHPGIVPVHELGLDDQGRVFFTMKLVKGSDFKAIMKLVAEGAEGWDLTRALGVLLRVCEAMAFAHEHGIVHRDLKPANIMVGSFGEAYVMDWGLARALDKEDHKDIRLAGEPASATEIHTFRDEEHGSDAELVTRDGDVVGTPAFMSPEQARGAMAEIDKRSDVYSVGAILYNLLTGEMPYRHKGTPASPHTVWRWVLDGPPQKIEDLRGGVPPELVAICEKAMARERHDRYADMNAMAVDLRAFLEMRVVKAYRTGPLVELRKWVARNKPTAISVGVGLVLLIAAGFMLAASESRRTRVMQERYRERLASALVTDADQSWPVDPKYAADMARWIEQAESLLSLPRSMDRPAVELAEPDQESMEQQRLRVAADTYEDYRERYIHELQGPGLDSEGRARIEHDLAVLEIEIPFIRSQLAELGQRSRRTDADGAEASFAADVRVLSSELEAVRARLEQAESLERRTLVDSAAAWATCTASIADPDRCPLYAGLEIGPQLGLIPLRQDLASGLWEFWHVSSGERPDVDPATGRYEIRPNTGLVLILVPGSSTYLLGAQSVDSHGSNYDPEANPPEGPVRTVALAAYLLSKYELTQGQWLRLAGNMPSEYLAGYGWSGYPRISRMHPLEQVSCDEAERFLGRWSLSLPTEAQWERAARTPFGLEDLKLLANLGDRSMVDFGFREEDVESWNDGYPRHSPVDAFAPNQFGFHGMLGNVSEWVRDWYCDTLGDKAVARIVPGTGELVPSYARWRSVRGGNFKRDATWARVTRRIGRLPYTRDDNVGIRPACALQDKQ